VGRCFHSDCVGDGMTESHIKSSADMSSKTLHFHAGIIASCIADGIELDKDAVYHLKATVAICKAALQGEALKGADVYNEAIK